jgi:hypothetical protein
MESINGISFEDWGAACGNLAQGMPEEEVIKVLGIEAPVWQDTNEKWAGKLGDLMAEDMNLATTYGEYFANPKVGKFANVETGAVGIEDLLKIVPDYDTYQKIFSHQGKASDVGVDPITVLESYGINIGQWGTLNMHYMNKGINSMSSDDPGYNEHYKYYTALMKKWEDHWEDHYKDQKVDLSEDIDF